MQACLQVWERVNNASMHALNDKFMNTITIKSIKTDAHPQIKIMFWFLFASTKGAATRIKIVNLLRDQPYNANQIAKEVSLDYKAVRHHLDKLEKNNLVEKLDTHYGGSYYLSNLFDENWKIYDEISSRVSP
ncbi:MAG: winged helix-turn-helix domain-containing protein [Nitrosopumilaceae archaeon]|jgi:DNA-binding transcriptional ArsR family regulator